MKHTWEFCMKTSIEIKDNLVDVNFLREKDSLLIPDFFQGMKNGALGRACKARSGIHRRIYLQRLECA